MLSWLFPSTCPCDLAAKEWIEERLQWLEEEFDDHAFNGRPIVLPTPEFFPDLYDGSNESVRTLLNRVCGYMDVVPELVRLKLVSETGKIWLVNESGLDVPDGFGGTYEEEDGKFKITVDRLELGDLVGLVGTMAHELSHARLLGEGRIMREIYDHELLTDLNVVFHGLGIFLANSPRNWDSSYTRWPGTKLKKPEYMTPPMFGYALAHLAWFRGEENPTWAKYLHPNARSEFKQALRFLIKTGDSAFKPKKFRSKKG